uniref:Uncharacterized protein n=1 Tax=Anopheles epiroticus TaxID=199890 RepID=A0A182P775_9DIPT
MKRRSLSGNCGVGVFVIALVTVLVAFATPSWLVSDYRITGAKLDRLGLWTHCFRSLPDVNDDYQRRFFVGCRWVYDPFTTGYDEIRGFLIPPFMVATQFFYTLCAIGVILAMVLVLLYFLCAGPDQKFFVKLIKAISYLTLVASVCGSIGVIVFACFGNKDKWMPEHANNWFGWSFILACIGVVACGVASSLFFTEAHVQARKRRQLKESQTHAWSVGRVPSAAMSSTVEKNEYPKASNALVIGAVLSYVAAVFLLMSFCSPYWIVSYPESFSSFKNMGLWEYCFRDFTYPYYQFPKQFNGCHHIFSEEYYVIREYLLPGWLMVVQGFVTISFLFTFGSLIIMACEIIRWPLKFVLRYEWLLSSISFAGIASSSFFMFLAVAVFGGNAYRRDWLMYPKFNVLSWSYELAVVSFMILGLAALLLYKESRKSYEMRREAKNLVMQMQMHEPGYHPSHHTSRSLHSGGYI